MATRETVCRARIVDSGDLLVCTWTGQDGNPRADTLSRGWYTSRNGREPDIGEAIDIKVRIYEDGDEIAHQFVNRIIYPREPPPEQALQIEMLGAVLLGRIERLRLRA